jgi:hypothetical protein
MALSLSKLVSTNPLEIMINQSNKPFSPRIINWVEPIEISGILKTVIYTEVDSNFKKGERVFIINGNYDSDLLIKADKYKKGRDGYKIIDVDKCKIVLDIDYTGILPWIEDSIDNFIRVYPVRDNTEFKYVNRMITSEGGSIDNKFNIYQDNVIFTENNYTGFLGFGENTGLSGAPGFFIKGGTSSWINITNDFITNFPLFTLTYTSLSSNNRIKIMNSSFTYGGKEFKEGFIYKFENNEWVIDVTYFRPFIAKSNFRDGNFKGTWNSGLFGRQDKKIRWDGDQSIWNIGSLLNSIWATGSINSVFTSNQSYFADIDEFGLPYQKLNPSNNRGFGYNFIVDSEINTSTIKNGNFYRTLIGTQSSTFSSVESHIKSWTQSLNINIVNGEYNNCTFESVNIQTSEIKNSRINNSKIIRSKSTNSNYTESLFYGSKFNSDNIIKILSNDTWLVNVDPTNTSVQSTIYKFYISENSYLRMKHKDQFYISGILVNNNDILNFFDKKFILNNYTYHEDQILPGPGAVKTGFEYTVRLNTAKENEYIISGSSISGTNSNYLPSIDIHVQQSSGFGLVEGSIDITNAYIIDSDFRSGLFELSDWNSGSLINHNNDNIIPNTSSTGGYYNISITTIGDNKLTISMPTPISIDDDQIKIGSIVYLNSIDHVDILSNITTLPDTYRVSNIIPPRILILEEMASGTYSIISGLTLSSSFITSVDNNPIGNRYNYIHNVKIENSNIKSGIFRRSYIKNSVIYNQLYDNRDMDFTNILSTKSLILSEMIMRKTGNTIGSGLSIRSFLTSGDDKWNDGIFYNSSWVGQTFSNGVFRESRWENGKFLNGIFYKSNSGGGLSIFAPNYYSEKIQTYWRSGNVSNLNSLNDRYSWINGSFLNGEFYKSGWENGNFNNGRFYLSDWFNGTFSGGVLGDISISSNNTNFYNGIFDNGVVENANIFAKNTDFINIPGPTTPKLVIWNNGIFKSGVFGSTMFNSQNYEEYSNAIWYNGEFNGGTFERNARWKNGTFNGGKFTSGYGWTMSTSTYSTNYSWENGIFNGGQFGIGSSSNDKEFYTNGNSTWYTGEFNGGKFEGRVWNNGVLTSGDFEGSAATYSSISPIGTTCSNPNDFTNIFNESGLVLPHYFDFIPYNGYGLGSRVWSNGTLYEYSSPTFSAMSSVSFPYWIPVTMSLYLNKYHGLWRNGTITDVKDKFIKDKKIFTDIQRKITEKKITKIVNIKNALWNTGTFSHPSGTMLNCVWLDGRFEYGTFKASSFNPYVKRNGSTQSTFNFDDNTCYWQNGSLDNSDFYISKWNDGKFLLGTGVGMIWQNGVANYMNAFNVFWENGTWRNGNWYGSSFNLTGDGQINDDYMKQILFRGMSWSGTSSCHVWNVFIEDPTDLIILANATASPASLSTTGIVVGPPIINPEISS